MDSPELPDGYRHIAFAGIDSTNTEAFRRAGAGDPGRLWLTAGHQTRGRGRGGRTWTSDPGNLYASLLLQLDISLPTALQLPFVAGVAIHDAITTAAGDPSLADRLTLKWPNDLLLDGHKVCGILVESRPLAGRTGLAVATGFGVNISGHPPDTRHPASNLAVRGLAVTPATIFGQLARHMARRLVEWHSGAGFSVIRDAWQARAMAIGSDLTVSEHDNIITGAYAGLDADGALLLNVSGETRRIIFGDVMYPAPDGAPQQIE